MGGLLMEFVLREGGREGWVCMCSHASLAAHEQYVMMGHVMEGWGYRSCDGGGGAIGHVMEGVGLCMCDRYIGHVMEVWVM